LNTHIGKQHSKKKSKATDEPGEKKRAVKKLKANDESGAKKPAAKQSSKTPTKETRVKKTAAKKSTTKSRGTFLQDITNYAEI
jgi:hypothetical protein